MTEDADILNTDAGDIETNGTGAGDLGESGAGKRFLPIRLGAAIPALILVVLVLIVLMSGLAKGAAESAASLALGREVTFESFSISPFTGTVSFTGLQVLDEPAEKPGDTAQYLLVAKTGEGNLSIWQLLRGRAVIEKLNLDGVRCNVERTDDGRFNVEKLGKKPEELPPPTEEEKKEAKQTDWVATIRKVAEKLNEWRTKSEKKEEARQEGTRTIPPAEPDGSASYITREEPRLVIREISVTNLELELEDTSGEQLPPLVGGTAQIRNLSSSPRYHDSPISFTLGGKFGKAGDQGTLGLDGALAILRGQEASFGLDCSGKSLALTLLEPMFGRSLPVDLQEGVGEISSALTLNDFSKLHLAPTIILKNLKLSPDGTHKKVLGIPSEDFCDAVNRAKELAIKGLKITGTLDDPTFHWSDDFRESLKKLLLDAGKDYAVTEAEKYLGKGTKKLQKKAEKVLGKEGTEAIKKVEGLLKGKAKDGLEKGLKLIPGLGK